MKILNFTPHMLNVYDQNKVHIVDIASESVPARLQTRSVGGGFVNGIPLFNTVYGFPEGLPPYDPDTILVVSLLLRNALPDREDLYSPGVLIRDESGQPIGCVGLTR